MYTIDFTSEAALYISPTAFSMALYPQRDHTKLWHDTLAPTQRRNGLASVSSNPLTKNARPKHEQIQEE